MPGQSGSRWCLPCYDGPPPGPTDVRQTNAKGPPRDCGTGL